MIALAIDQGQEHGAQIRQKHRYISITSALSICTQAMSSISSSPCILYNSYTNIPAPAPNVIAQSPFKEIKSYIIPAVFNNTKKITVRFARPMYVNELHVPQQDLQGERQFQTQFHPYTNFDESPNKTTLTLNFLMCSSFKMKGKGWRGECTCQHILLNYLDTKCVPQQISKALMKNST